MASNQCASSLWDEHWAWTGASCSPPSRSGQSQGPGQTSSSRLRTAGTLTWKSACVYICVCTCARTGNEGWRWWGLHRTEPRDPTPAVHLTATAFFSRHHWVGWHAPHPHPSTAAEICPLLFPVPALENWNGYRSHGALILTHCVTRPTEVDSRGWIFP